MLSALEKAALWLGVGTAAALGTVAVVEATKSGSTPSAPINPTSVALTNGHTYKITITGVPAGVKIDPADVQQGVGSLGIPATVNTAVANGTTAVITATYNGPTQTVAAPSIVASFAGTYTIVDLGVVVGGAVKGPGPPAKPVAQGSQVLL